MFRKLAERIFASPARFCWHATCHASRGRYMDSVTDRIETDEELINRCRLAPDATKSRQLIDELWRRHHDRVVAWCGRLTGDRDLAPDLAQDVFMRAYSALDTFRRGAKFTTWLYVIARNRCLDEQRARAAGAREASTDAALYISCDWNRGVAALDARDARIVVRGLMDAVLDETEKRVMILHYGHDVPVDTITAALGLSNASGAKAFIVSARRKLTRAVRRWNVQATRGQTCDPLIFRPTACDSPEIGPTPCGEFQSVAAPDRTEMSSDSARKTRRGPIEP
jgi:RNA polymerase sigma-70 factor (ECF subfamily)